MDINQIGSHTNLTEEESLELAKKTNEIFKNRSIDDLVSIKLDAIKNAMAIINSPKVKNTTIKNILVDLLDMIVELTSATKEVYNWKSKSFMNNIWGNDLDINMGDSSDFASQIQSIQDKLTSEYSELINTSKQDLNTTETIKQIIKEIITKSGILIEGTNSIDESIKVAIDEIRGNSVLTPYLNQDDNVDFDKFVEEIRVDDYNDIRVVIGGRERRVKESFRSPKHALLFANKLIRDSGSGGEFSQKAPFVRVRLGATTRVSMMRDPIAIRDPKLCKPDEPVVHMCIRRQRSAPFKVEKLLQLGSINEYGAKLLQTILSSGISVLFYGGTGTGKTSMFNAFTGTMSTGERMITMAEIDEMKVRNIDYRKVIKDLKTGEERNNPEFRKATNSAIMWECPDLNTRIFGDLKGFDGMFNAALTMTPYTIMIQESKGTEAKKLAEAAISDHQVLTTVHAKNEKVLINRLYKMMQSGGDTTSEDVIFRDICDAFPVVVGCSRLKDGSRKIFSIVEYMGYIPTTREVATNTMCKFVTESNIIKDGKLQVIGKHKNYALPSPKLKEEMLIKGMLTDTWNELENLFLQDKSDKPKHMDRIAYTGDLYAV